MTDRDRKVRIVQVVGNASPGMSGVGDYAMVLGQAIVDGFQREIEVITMACGHQPTGEMDSQIALELTGARGRKKFFETVVKLHPNVLLVHYVGYAYAKRGAPIWLVRNLAEIKRQFQSIFIFTVFHEIYATGWPWQSSFWLSLAQRYSSVEIFNLSDEVSVTSRESGAWLSSHSRQKSKPRVLPVCSNVGEPFATELKKERAPVAVIFGSGGLNPKFFRCQFAEIERYLVYLGIEAIVHVGSEMALAPSGVLPFRDLGRQPKNIVSETLINAAVGLIAYPAALFSKSGVVASYSAHGVPTIIIDKDKKWGLLNLTNSEVCHILPKTLGELREFGMAASEWYRDSASVNCHASYWMEKIARV